MSLRAALFAGLGSKPFRAELRADRSGRLCGLPEALPFLDGLDLRVDFHLPEDSDVETNTLVLSAVGTAAGPGPALVIQIHRVTGSLREEVEAALAVGAHVLMADTGREADLVRCRELLDAGCRRSGKEPLVAFAGDQQMEDIPHYSDLGADIICLGKAIIDAPMLDFHLDVLDARAGG